MNQDIILVFGVTAVFLYAAFLLFPAPYLPGGKGRRIASVKRAYRELSFAERADRLVISLVSRFIVCQIAAIALYKALLAFAASELVLVHFPA